MGFHRQYTPAQLAAHEAHKARMARMAPQPVAALPPTDTPPLRNKKISLEQRIANLQEENANLRERLADVAEREAKDAIPVRKIQQACCYYYCVALRDVVSGRRTGNLIMPRQIAMWMSKRLTGRSLPELGRAFGGRDHTTILHAVRKIEAMRQVDAKLDETLEAIMAVCRT